MKRIALLTSRAKHKDAMQNFFQHACISLGPFYLESYLRQYGPTCDVILVDDFEEIFSLNVDLVGLSAVTENFTVASEQAREIKNRLGIPVIVGGPHISALPKSLPEAIDVGVIGEGEETFRQLILAYQAREWQPSAWKNIEGIVYRDQSELFITKPRKLITPIDLIPKPRRIAWAEHIGLAHLVSSRGCPFQCAFCSESEGVSRYRVFSVERIVEEIKDLVLNYPVKTIRFFDDVFNVNLKHLKALSAALRAEGLTEEVGFSAWARSGLMNEAMLEVMQGFNMRSLAFGMESGSNSVLARLKSSTQVEDNQRALDLCVSAGIHVAGAFIIGTPGETTQDLDATLKFIEKNKDKFMEVEINPFVPLPGSALWSWALKQGHVRENMEDWGELKDWSYFFNFDPNRYRFLNTSMSLQEFVRLVESFKQVYQEIGMGLKAQKIGQELYPNMQASRLRNALYVEASQNPVLEMVRGDACLNY